MAWIESHQSLARHSKTLLVMEELRVERHKLIGHLHELWWWGLDNADIQGNLGAISTRVIAEGAGWPVTTADKFVGALVRAVFLEHPGPDYVLHDWYDYAGKLMERRVDNAARMRARRDQRDLRTSGARAEHVQDTADAPTAAHFEHVQDTSGSPTPNGDVHVHVHNSTATNLARDPRADEPDRTQPDPTGVLPPNPPSTAKGGRNSRRGLSELERVESKRMAATAIRIGAPPP